MEQKQVKFEVKSVDDDGTFTGYAAVFGNTDSDGEIIDKGAFKRTLDHSNGVVPILWQHNRQQPCGWNVEAKEDGHGLLVKGRLLIDTELGKLAQSYLKTGLEVGGKPGLSIGFTVPKGGDYFKAGARHFREVALKEYSVVTFPANDQATVTAAKGDGKTKRVDGVDLPASCFAYVGDPERTETWKLPINFPGDDAKTKTHIRNALARFGQTQGIPASERTAVLARIHAAAKKHGIDAGDKSAMETPDQFSALYEEREAIEKHLSESVWSAQDDEALTTDERKASIADAYSEYADAMTEWQGKMLDARNEAAEDAEKSGRSISAATASEMQKAMGHFMEGRGLYKQADAAHQKGIGVLKDLSEGPYANDVNKPNPAGGGKSKESDPDEIHSLLEVTRSLATKTSTAK